MPGPGPGIIIVLGPGVATGMQNPKRGLSSATLEPALIYAAALTCGVLAALALQLQLSHAGFDLATLWENLLSAQGRQLRTTGPWWAIAGAAFVTGGVVAAALSRLPLPWRRYRLLRWTAGALIVLLLAHVGHFEVAPDDAAAGLTVAVRLLALVLAGLMAALGAYLALRR
jgi:hypothetical protein